MIRSGICILLFLTVAGRCTGQRDTIQSAYPLFDTATQVHSTTDTASPFMTRAKQNLSKAMYYLSFAEYNDKKVDRPLLGPDEFKCVQGRRINSVAIKILDPFGTDIDDPENNHPTKLQTFANRLQNKTKIWVIRNELLFHEGDTLDPLALSDSERNLWIKNVYKDIRFVIEPAGDNMVNIIVYIRDRWNWSLSTTADFRRITIGPNVSNLFGAPQQVGVAFSFNYRLDNPYTIALGYSYSNIAATHMDVALTARYDNLQRGGELFFNRPFYSSKTIWAGHVILDYFDQQYIVPFAEGPAILAPNQVNRQDFWMAKTYELPSRQLTKKFPTYKLITAVRMIRQAYPERPFIYSADGTISFLNQTSMLGGIGFAQWDYYVDHNVYTLVQAEYFPKGLSAAVIGGWQTDELLQQRLYAAGAVQYGRYFRGIGYILTQFKMGGFPVMNTYAQLLADWRNTFYTIPERIGTVSFRHIFNFYGKWGYDRPFGRDISVDNFTGLRGLYSNQLRGNNTYALDYELDIYQPKKVLGFTTGMFLFSDFALIQQSLHDLTFQPGMGIGFRLRNVSLNIDFIQLMIAYYPGLNIPYQNPYNLLGDNANDRQLRNRDLLEPTILTVN